MIPWSRGFSGTAEGDGMETYEDYLKGGPPLGEFEADFEQSKYGIPGICRRCTYYGEDPGECEELDQWPSCKYMREND